VLYHVILLRRLSLIPLDEQSCSATQKTWKLGPKIDQMKILSVTNHLLGKRSYRLRFRGNVIRLWVTHSRSFLEFSVWRLKPLHHIPSIVVIKTYKCKWKGIPSKSELMCSKHLMRSWYSTVIHLISAKEVLCSASGKDLATVTLLSGEASFRSSLWTVSMPPKRSPIRNKSCLKA